MKVKAQQKTKRMDIMQSKEQGKNELAVSSFVTKGHCVIAHCTAVHTLLYLYITASPETLQ